MLIVTHGGKFHADDAWAVAVLQILYPEADLVRTRDPAIIDTADFVVDVGGIWDPATGRFDHHQKGFTGARQSGVPYASAGLVWRDYGARCVRQLAETHTGRQVSDDTAQQIANKVVGGAVNGSVVLMHLGGYETFDALQIMVPGLRHRGFTLTSISDQLDGR